MLISELLQDVAAPKPVKTRIVKALAAEGDAYGLPGVETVEDLLRFLADEKFHWLKNDPRKVLERGVANLGKRSVDILIPLIEPYLNPEETTAMNFEQELLELVTAALEAGVDRDTIISALEERAAFLTAQEAEEAEDDES